MDTGHLSLGTRRNGAGSRPGLLLPALGGVGPPANTVPNRAPGPGARRATRRLRSYRALHFVGPWQRGNARTVGAAHLARRRRVDGHRLGPGDAAAARLAEVDLG